MNIKIIILTLFIAFELSACGGGSSTSNAVDQTNSSTSYRLRNSTSSGDLEKTLKDLMLQTYGKVSPPVAIYATTAENSNDSAAQFSTTNTQEQSVDEADRLKNDSEYLYVASSEKPEIQVYSTQTGQAVLSHKVTVSNSENKEVSGLYLTKNKLVSITSDNAYFLDQWFTPNFWNDRQTQLDFFNAEDGVLNPLDSLIIEGKLISSRRIDSTLYLVVRHTPSLDGLILYPSNAQEVAHNRALIEASTLSDLLANYSVNQIAKGNALASNNCFTTDYQDSNNKQASIINILAIDLNNPTAQPQGLCYIGDTEAVYASSKSLYLATTQHQYEVNNHLTIYQPNISTDIHKLSLNVGDISYQGSANIAGHLGWQQDLKSFRMGEFNNDLLGIITYTGERADSNSSPATLYTLKTDTNSADTLKILGKLPNEQHPEALGKPGEQIYAVRFFNNRAYLVTFRATDPLYIVDLADPENPYIASSLEINGYSDYLHPVGDNFVLGIGKDAIPATNDQGDARGAWYQGVKLSLIDVSDPTAPFEANQIKIGKRGTNTAVSYTHHAFTSMLQNDGDMRIALPISVHTNDPPKETDTASTFHEWQFDALYSYTINTYTGTMYTRESIKVDKQAGETITSDWRNHRSAFIGNKIYYLHGDEIISSDW